MYVVVPKVSDTHVTACDKISNTPNCGEISLDVTDKTDKNVTSKKKNIYIYINIKRRGSKTQHVYLSLYNWLTEFADDITLKETDERK